MKNIFVILGILFAVNLAAGDYFFSEVAKQVEEHLIQKNKKEFPQVEKITGSVFTISGGHDWWAAGIQGLEYPSTTYVIEGAIYIGGFQTGGQEKRFKIEVRTRAGSGQILKFYEPKYLSHWYLE